MDARTALAGLQTKPSYLLRPPSAAAAPPGFPLIARKLLFPLSLKGTVPLRLQKQPILGSYSCNSASAQASAPTSDVTYELADIDWDSLGFAFSLTDYMYSMKCTNGESFSGGQLQRFGNIELSPSSGVLNYGQGLFEGLKAYRKEDGTILLFRPEENALRMKEGAERMCMPSPTVEQFVEAVKATVLANKRWVPPPGKGSLYIRPLLMGSGAVLGIAPSPEYTFLIYVSPVGNYFKEGLAPINLIVETEVHRATPGGTGGVKTIGNYASVLKAQTLAKTQGFTDVLYLDCVSKKYVEEVSSCNIFIVKGNVRERSGSHARRTKGGLITMPFIFANEVCEKLAVVGFATNMISYLTQQLHLPITQAANTLTNFGGTSSLTPLLGAFISDAYAGRFWTIAVASIFYQIGMTCLTISAILPNLRPPPCQPNQVCQQATSGQVTILYIALLLNAIGAGGIRPCCVAFGADQFDEIDPKQKTKTWRFFNWYYFCMGASMLVAVTVIVYIQDNVGWGWGLGIPTMAMFLSIVTFVGGYPMYRNMDPAGSPFTRLVQVCVAAFRKRNLSQVSDPSMLYGNEDLDRSISVAGRLLHSKNMRFLDKAAIVIEDDDVNTPNLWRLNTIHRVEELKSIIRMGPIWAAGILLITAYAQQNTFSLQQAKTMDRHLIKSFQIPAGSMSVFTMTSMLVTIAFYDRIFIPLMQRLTGIDRGITFLHRMGIGFVISILATLVAGFIEIKRKNTASIYNLTNNAQATIPISVFWLVPQYSLHGIAEAFMSIGHLEFFYDQAPESMRSTAMALFWTAISLGNYVSTFLVSLVHKFTAGPGGSNWLPDSNLNLGRLECFYWLITTLQVVNFVYYVFCSKFYMFKPIEMYVTKKEGECDAGDGVELARQV